MLANVAETLDELFDIGLEEHSIIHADHNHVRAEVHEGVELWVHRKGAQSARADEPGIVPGSMGTASFHTLGRGCSESLCSSSHGAGRALSRAAAARTIGKRQLLDEMQGVWFDQRHARSLRDEAPSAYKDIFAVMRAAAPHPITTAAPPALKSQGRVRGQTEDAGRHVHACRGE